MSDGHRCGHSEITCAYAAQALPASEIAAAEVHIAACPDCQSELASLRPVIDSFVAWPTDLLRPTTPLQARLADRIAEGSGKAPVLPPARPDKEGWSEPEWEPVAPGIDCKLLATDTERHRVSMLVRLAPGASYPPHTHAGTEELHLLDGELWIEELKLFPGDYNYGAPGDGDERVWSETGCTCLLITSTRDSLLGTYRRSMDVAISPEGDFVNESAEINHTVVELFRRIQNTQAFLRMAAIELHRMAEQEPEIAAELRHFAEKLDREAEDLEPPRQRGAMHQPTQAR